MICQFVIRVTVESQSDDLGLFVGNFRQQAIDEAEFLFKIFWFERHRLWHSFEGNGRREFRFPLMADAKVCQHSIEIGRQILDFLTAFAQSLVEFDENILHSIFGIVEVSQSIAGVLQ